MRHVIKGIGLSFKSFFLPWLFAYWLWWTISRLALPWHSDLSALLAAIIGYLLLLDTERCLERFYRKESQKTPAGQGGSYLLHLLGLKKLVTLYIIVALAMYGGGLISTLTYSLMRPVVWEPLFRGTALIPASQAALAASLIALVAGLIAYAVGRQKLFPDEGSLLRGRRVGDVKEAREKLAAHREPGEQKIAWGGLFLPWPAGTCHFITVGQPGSGKTNLILQFMASVLV